MSNSFILGNQSNNEWHFELIGWNGSRMRNNNCYLMTHFLSPFREPRIKARPEQLSKGPRLVVSIGSFVYHRLCGYYYYFLWITIYFNYIDICESVKIKEKLYNIVRLITEQRITSDVKIEVLEMRVTNTWSVSIWLKATELQYFPRVVRLIIIMYN